MCALAAILVPSAKKNCKNLRQTQGALAQSPEAGARDKVLDNNPDRIGI